MGGVDGGFADDGVEAGLSLVGDLGVWWVVGRWEGAGGGLRPNSGDGIGRGSGVAAVGGQDRIHTMAIYAFPVGFGLKGADSAKRDRRSVIATAAGDV